MSQQIRRRTTNPLFLVLQNWWSNKNNQSLSGKLKAERNSQFHNTFISWPFRNCTFRSRFIVHSEKEIEGSFFNSNKGGLAPVAELNLLPKITVAEMDDLHEWVYSGANTYIIPISFRYQKLRII